MRCGSICLYTHLRIQKTCYGEPGMSKKKGKINKKAKAKAFLVERAAKKLFRQRQELIPYRNRSNTFGPASPVRVISPTTGKVVGIIRPFSDAGRSLKGYLGTAGVRPRHYSEDRLLLAARVLFEVTGDTLTEVCEAVSSLSQRQRRELGLKNGHLFGALHSGSHKGGVHKLEIRDDLNPLDDPRIVQRKKEGPHAH